MVVVRVSSRRWQVVLVKRGVEDADIIRLQPTESHGGQTAPYHP